MSFHVTPGWKWRDGVFPWTCKKVLLHPQQIMPETRGKKAYQSIIDFGSGKKFLVRAIMADDNDPPVVITVYRTSKIHKYWRMP